MATQKQLCIGVCNANFIITSTQNNEDIFQQVNEETPVHLYNRILSINKNKYQAVKRHRCAFQTPF